MFVRERAGFGLAGQHVGCGPIHVSVEMAAAFILIDFAADEEFRTYLELVKV